MTTLTRKAPTAAEYQAIFDAERQQVYPVVDAFEARMGFALERDRLEDAARVLACPLKGNPPNWQHGRVLYAAVRRHLAEHDAHGCALVDIGTAKGFSALCLLWARQDAGSSAAVWSCDVIDPKARTRRNTVAEVDGLLTLAETLDAWPESHAITFKQATGLALLEQVAAQGTRVACAFVDGKHTGGVVAEEGRWLACLQQPGDLAIFDDVHLDDVGAAVRGLKGLYEIEWLHVLKHRAYAVGVRRG